jgi:hypothetical protein
MRQMPRWPIGPLMISVFLATTVAAGTKSAKPPPDPQGNAAAILKEFPRYQLPFRRPMRNIVIAPGPSLEALTALAKRLHRDDPHSMFRIFTDGDAQQFQRFRLWHTHFGQPDSAQYPYPKEWANRHNIAIINEFMVGRGWQLQIFNGTGIKPPVDVGHAVDLD